MQETAERTGLSEHTLRYYERAGLLTAVRRDDSSGHRRYSADDVARISTLACLRATGMPLDQMRTPPHGGSPTSLPARPEAGPELKEVP